MNVNDPGYRLWLGQLKSSGVDVDDRDQVLARHQIAQSMSKMLTWFGLFLVAVTLLLLLTPLAFLIVLLWPLTLIGAASLWYGRRSRAKAERLLALHQAQMGWPA